MGIHLSKVRSLLERSLQPNSLRMRLMLWYGTLLAVALVCLAALVLVIATRAINQGVDDAVRAEARLTGLAAPRKLSPDPPYWTSKLLLLPTIDTYRDPGAAVEILDTQQRIRYYSAGDTATNIPVRFPVINAALKGQSPIWYTTTIGKGHVRVEALPFEAPTIDAFGNVQEPSIDTNGMPSHGGPIIGVLLVAKSLSDVDQTLFLLQTLLLLSGLSILAATLLVSWLLAMRVLRPLSGIVATAHAIVSSTARGTRLGNLSQRVPQLGGRDELAQVVDTLNEMLASLESAMGTQRRFVADASHELRAPHTTIQGNLSFLQHHFDDLPPDEWHTMLADAHEETLRLAELVDELLLLARADANMDQSPQEDQGENDAQGMPRGESLVELDHALLQLIRQLRGRLNAAGSQLKLELGRIEPVRVRGDEASLRRVVLILLDNALKYTPSNAGAGHITVSLERVNGEAALRVRDTGIGIDALDLPHIFERFYRSDRARSRHGTGLGLAIAQTEVERLGGHIEAESTPGKGSTFSVWLPIA